MALFRISFLILLAPCLTAQTSDTPIFEQSGTAVKKSHDEIIRKALLAREKVSAIDKTEIDKQILAPKPEPVELAAPFSKALSAEEIARHARESNLRVGYCYLCMNCENWHINLAGGYAIAPNVIVTCDHVLCNKTRMRDGFIVAFDLTGNIACGVAVLARNATMDTAIIKVAGAVFSPVPLNAEVKQGSPSYCFSYPLKQQGYFSTGVINRFYWHERYQGQDRNSIDALSYLRVNYSNDWAPGSSGSPLFDPAGNITGHVSTITGLSGGKNGSPMLTLHEGVPARAVLALAGALEHPPEIARIANFPDITSKTPITGDKAPKEKPDTGAQEPDQEKPEAGQEADRAE
ncbi:MAG: hypothetical protein RL346_907 [Verrucomicrobiota bacterium]|jgi:hypothetical protein